MRPARQDQGKIVYCLQRDLVVRRRRAGGGPDKIKVLVNQGVQGRGLLRPQYDVLCSLMGQGRTLLRVSTLSGTCVLCVLVRHLIG